MQAFIGSVRALYAHRPRRYDGPVTLIQTIETADTNDAAWDILCPRLKRRIVPGDHYTMLRPPHLAMLATAVGDALRETVTVPGGTTPAGPGS
jgi:thioesterase domain-containing protein